MAEDPSKMLKWINRHRLSNISTAICQETSTHESTCLQRNFKTISIMVVVGVGCERVE